MSLPWAGGRVNQYEAEPQNWDAAASDAQKTNLNVFYEFQHVTSRGSRYLVCCNAHHLLHHGRRLPMNPLRNTCPSCLTFSVEFFEAVGRNVREGIQFEGITYDGDKPEILRQLPNEGVDVQKESVQQPQCDYPYHYIRVHAQCLLAKCSLHASEVLGLA